MGGIVAPVTKQLDLPLVVSFYGKDASEASKRPEWKVEYPRLWKIADTVLALSEEMKRSLIDIGCPEDKIDIVHLSRDLNDFHFSIATTPIRDFLSVGRLTEKKGHMDTLHAFKRLESRYPKISLRIIGGGPLRRQLQNYIDTHGLNSSVSLLGSLPNNEVAVEMQEADAFILSSKESRNGDREGTPTVLVEAQATGLPCISTFHAGIPEIIPEENHHFLAPEGNEQAISSRMDNLMKCSEEEVRKISVAGREKVYENFNLKRETSRLQKIYIRCAEK
jgi:glycosyltransferase involved in cell wall biosynthesis